MKTKVRGGLWKILNDIKGVTQVEVARQTGIYNTRLCEYNYGRKKPTSAHIDILAKFYGLRSDLLHLYFEVQPKNEKDRWIADNLEERRDALTKQFVAEMRKS